MSTSEDEVPLRNSDSSPSPQSPSPRVLERRGSKQQKSSSYGRLTMDLVAIDTGLQRVINIRDKIIPLYIRYKENIERALYLFFDIKVNVEHHLIEEEGYPLYIKCDGNNLKEFNQFKEYLSQKMKCDTFKELGKDQIMISDVNEQSDLLAYLIAVHTPFDVQYFEDGYTITPAIRIAADAAAEEMRNKRAMLKPANLATYESLLNSQASSNATIPYGNSPSPGWS